MSMTDQDLDDDTINALNAEVRRQRTEALDDAHLVDAYRSVRSEDLLQLMATAARGYEALVRAGR
jgi:hypothetical protein